MGSVSLRLNLNTESYCIKGIRFDSCSKTAFLVCVVSKNVPRNVPFGLRKKCAPFLS